MERFFTVICDKIYYLDDTKIVFRDDRGKLYIGKTRGIDLQIGTSSYTSEPVVFECHELELKGKSG